MAFINNLLGRNIRTLGLLLTIILLSLSVSHAQTFPVQANIHIAPPYSVYLSQYTSPEQEKVMVNILLRDPVITSLDVKFRFTIEGGGIKLTTNPAWNQQPFNLAGGIATTLSQDLIAQHLKPQNLLIEGVNPQEFFRSGKLPEGFYEFKVEVIEFRRGITISNIGRAGIWLTLNEAPRIVFPLASQKVKATNPQMLNFTWIPGGASSPLSNLNTMYEFTLVELPDKSIDPTVAITTASNASKFVKTLDQTSLFYGPGEMPLIPGKTYAFRVKAYNTQGYELFKNGGYSEVRTFTFGDACNAPVSFSLQNSKQSSFDINVYTDPSNTAWKSRFRERTAGSDLTGAGADLQFVTKNSESSWSELKAEDGTSLKSIMGLKPTTTYEVQVKGLCGDIASDYTQTQTITTKPMVDANRSCSSNPTPFAVDNVASLAQLKKNDIFLAALFPIKVMDVKSQGGGKFSGRGIATLPLFNTCLAVTFDNVGINQLMQLTSGEVKVVRDELNITLFDDTPTPPGGGGTGGTVGSGGTTIVYPPINDTIVIPTVYDSLVVNDNTLIIYPPNGGAPVTVDLGGDSCTLLIPTDGNMDNAQIVYDGAAHPYHPTQGNINNDDPKNFTGLIAHFKPDNNSLLGFDTLKYSVLANYYKQLTVAGKQRYLPWKAIKDGTPELVNLRIKQGTDKMPFYNLKVKQIGMGDLTPSASAGTQSQTYVLSGSYKGLEESVIAYYSADGKENYAGGLYIATYEQKKYKLFLVPLPGVNIPDDAKGRLTNELSTIYSQAVVSWNVDILKDFKGVDLGDNGLDWANKDMLSSYNTEMNSLISAFKGWKPSVDPDAYYLFIVPKFSEGNVEGFMPRNRRFGFVTQSQLDGRTIAHELGHGAFNLKHTFSPSDWNIQQGITDNLMDYPSTAGQAGKKLWKPQWDFICNPEITTGLWDGMEEGAVIDVSKLISIDAGTGIKMSNSITCLSIAGVPITLPKNLVSVEFVTNNNYAPEGALVSFKVLVDGNETTYVGVYNSVTKVFLGYSKVINPNETDILKKCESKNGVLSLYEDKVTKTLIGNANTIVHIGFKLGCSVDVRTIPLSAYTGSMEIVNTGSGAKPVDIKAKYYADSKLLYNEFDERLCPTLPIKFDKITFKDFFTGYEWAHYNVYGDGGVLIKLKIDNWDQYYYTNQDDKGNFYCYRYVYRYQLDDGYWIKSEIPQPTSGDSYSNAILSSQFAIKFIKQIGPTTLDAASAMPIYGIPFGVVNGIWYLGKGEKGNAFLSFATCIPLGYIVNAGVKWSHLIVQTGKETYQIIHVSEETNSILKVFLTNAENIPKTVIDDGVKGIIGIAEKSTEYRQIIKVLVEGAQDRAKLIDLLKRASSLGDDSKTLELLTDITVKTTDVNHIANNLDKIDDDIIEAWKLLDGSPVIRKGFENLENLKKVLKSEVYKNWGTLDELKAAINSSGSKAKLIENLSKANPASKYPIEGLRELAASWQDAAKVKRFKDADEFYKAGYGTSNMDNINAELRGIDFDNEIDFVTVKKDDYIYQYVRVDDAGNPILSTQGNYFIKDPVTPKNTLGFSTERRMLVKFKVTQDVVFLKSKASSIEWSDGGVVFTGGSDQYFIPNSKVRGIVFEEIYNK